MEELVKKFMRRIDFQVLDESFNKCSDKTEGEGVQCCQTCFKQQFFGQNKISYSCVHKKRLYVVRLLPVHVKEIELALQQALDFFQSEVQENTLNAVFLGGGPGVESIAIRKFLTENSISPRNVLFVRTDIEPTWDGVAGTIIKHFHPDINENGKVEDNGVLYQYGKVHVNLLDAKRLTTVSHFNLFTLSYFLSEVASDKLNNLVSLILSKVNSKAVIIINEREELGNLEKAVLLCKKIQSNCTIESIKVSADRKTFDDPSKEEWFNSRVKAKLSDLAEFEVGERVSSDIHTLPLYKELCEKLSIYPKSKTQSFRITLVINK